MENWKDLRYKDRVAYSTAIVSFAIGWLLIIINFFIPPMGIVADTTLWILGQSLAYTGAVVGITAYAKSEVRKIRKDLDLPEE